MTPGLELVPYKTLEDTGAAVDSDALGRSEPWESVFWSPSFASVQGVFDLRAVIEDYTNLIEDRINKFTEGRLLVAVSDFCSVSVPV